MLSEQELRELGEDIKKNGLQDPAVRIATKPDGKAYIADCRDRLTAMELVGIEVIAADGKHKGKLDPSVFVIEPVEYDDVAKLTLSWNVHRRHLGTKQEQAALIARVFKAAEAKHPQVGEVSSKGGRGNKDETKAKIVDECAKAGIQRIHRRAWNCPG